MATVAKVTDQGVVLENHKGIALDIRRDNDGLFELGDVRLNGHPVSRTGPGCLLREANTWENARDPFSNSTYPGTRWSPNYKLRDCTVTENGPEKATVLLRGRVPSCRLTVQITLRQQSSALEFAYEVEPRSFIKHELYVPLPFPADAMEFVQWPFETPLTPPFDDTWTQYPTRATVPVLLGHARRPDAPLYTALGYHLEQEDITRGKIEYAAGADSGCPLRIYFPARHFGVTQWDYTLDWGGARRNSYRLRFALALAETQTECMRGYREASGYSTDLPGPVRDVEPAVRAFMESYRETAAYVTCEGFPGKAYHFQVKRAASEPPMETYGRFILVGANVHLAHQLYKYYLRYPDQRWARDRAEQVATFFTHTVDNDIDMVPTLYDPVNKVFTTFNGHMKRSGHLYTTAPQASAALSLYELAEKMEANEARDCSEWKALALRLADVLANKVLATGRLAREYNRESEEGGLCTSGWPLIMLDELYARTGRESYEKARRKLECWNYDSFIRINHHYGVSIDDGALDAPHACNHDLFDVMTLATYYTGRHLKTGEGALLDIATALVHYYWSAVVPYQMPHYRHITKGLDVEQDSYIMYDVPWHCYKNLAALPKLSELTGDRFYKDFFDMLVQTQLAHQFSPDSPFRGFHIGLAPTPEMTAPEDLPGESNRGFILEFGAFFFDCLTHDYVKYL